MNNDNITEANEITAKLKKPKLYIQHDAPSIIGVESINHFKKSFYVEVVISFQSSITGSFITMQMVLKI